MTKAEFKKLVENGQIPEALIDESAFRVLMMKNQLGLFEDPFAGLGKSEKLTPYYRAKAYELTSESCVLLKNEKILPLCQKQRVIWAGPYVTSKEFLSRWSIFGEHEAVETIEDILQKKQIKAECMPGCRMLSDEECKIWQVEPERFDEPGNERWLETITGEDTVVCVLGEHESQSGEAASRAFLTLPEEQQLFFEKNSKAHQKYCNCGNHRKTAGSAKNIRKIQGCYYGMETRNYGSGSSGRHCIRKNQSFRKTGCKYPMVCGTGAGELLGYKNRTYL